MLLADRILNWPVIVPAADKATRLQVTQRMRDLLLDARIVRAQAVYERARGGVEIDFREIAPIPPVSSPIWVEYSPSSGGQMGAIGLFEGDESGGVWVLQSLISGGDTKEAMWLGEEFVLPTSAGFMVTEGGTQYAQPWLSDLMKSRSDIASGTLHFGVTLFTVALLAAHNIGTRWVDPPAHTKKRTRRSRHNRPLIRHEEIVVRPAPLERNRSITRDSGIEQPGHTVRGHFAHYGSCCPAAAHEPKGRLFGRYDRKLWIDEHEAGKPELGHVVSDFRVEDCGEA
jgi:hypothetical protein